MRHNYGGSDQDFYWLASNGTTDFGIAHWVVLAPFVAMVLWLFTLWGTRLVQLGRQEKLLEGWARARGYAFEPKPDVRTASELLPFGSEASSGTLSARLFAGFVGRPPMWAAGHVSYRWLMTSSANSFDSSESSRDVRIWESRELNGKASRPVPTTRLGTVVHTRFSSLVGVKLRGDMPPVIVTPRAGHRFTLGVHRRLSVRTGNKKFDRRFAVLTLDAGAFQHVVNERLRSQLLREGIPPKSSLVFEGRTCYVSGYGLLTPTGLDERIALAHSARRLLEAQEIY